MSGARGGAGVGAGARTGAGARVGAGAGAQAQARAGAGIFYPVRGRMLAAIICTGLLGEVGV